MGSSNGTGQLKTNTATPTQRRRGLPRWSLILGASLLVVLVMALVFYLAGSSGKEPALILDTWQTAETGSYRDIIHIKHRLDGSVSFRREERYALDSGALLRLRIFDGDNRLIYCQQRSYKDGLISEKLLLSSEGSVIRRTAYEYEGSILVGKSFYDAYGNLLQSTRYSADGKVTYWETHEFDSKNQEIKFSRYTADRKLDYWHEYSYNAQGLMLNHTRFNSDGSRRDWSDYTYDEQGRLLCQKQFDAAGELNVQTDYTYTDSGFSTWTYFYRYDGTMSKELSIYDQNGNRTHYEAYPNGGYISHGNDSKYDENGNLIEYAEFGLYGLVTKWYEYEYDEQGRELRRSTHGLYERPTSYENRYDAEGNCIERIYYDEDGNVTDRVKDPTPELSFRYIYRPDY